ncbi:MAG: sensor histidine kinase [Butyrivibrio sp.]|nr:sensor histidine kinase [Butyrivibrio sp.]
MNKLFGNIAAAFRQTKMKTQMIIMYFAAVFTPILCIGAILIAYNVSRLEEYHSGLLNANNNRVRSVMYEITNQIQSISDEIAFDGALTELLSREYPMDKAFCEAVDGYGALESYKLNYAGVADVFVYTNQKGASDYRNFRAVTDEIETQSWYMVAKSRYSVYWDIIENADSYGNSYWNLTLVRKITLYDTDAEAILMIKVSDNYLGSRIEDNDCSIMLAIDDGRVFYGPDRSEYGRSDMLDFVNPDDNYFTYEGEIAYNGAMIKSCVSTLNMPRSDSWVYVVTMSNSAYASIWQLTVTSAIIIMFALVLPAVIMSVFIKIFSKQVNAMRDEMYRASQGDYDMLERFEGCYELNAAYGDLKIMVEKIKEKDERMYEGVINEQRLLNEQQKMEFRMLASQINPHFLYNTLEMIRMKAIVAGDGETATAIKLLGKSMRYVLDNTGIQYTTLDCELSHIETYLQIQRLRFGDRVNYALECRDGLEPEHIQVLPLLLQPIVENAIVHGLEEVEKDGMIRVSVTRDESRRFTVIAISDNGCGMDAKALKSMRRNLEKGTMSGRYGIGLYNVSQRIRLCYGEGCGLTVDSICGEGTTVTAKIRYVNV